MKTDLFQSCGHCWVFQICWHIECSTFFFYLFIYLFFKFYFIFKLYIIVLVLPNIKMNLPQVYMCSPSWTLLTPPSPFHPSGSSQCTSPKHPVSCIEPGLATRFIHDISQHHLSGYNDISLFLTKFYFRLRRREWIVHFVLVVQVTSTPWTAAQQASLSLYIP